MSDYRLNSRERGTGTSDWWARLDSNQEPTDYESAALTVELRARLPHAILLII